MEVVHYPGEQQVQDAARPVCDAVSVVSAVLLVSASASMAWNGYALLCLCSFVFVCHCLMDVVFDNTHFLPALVQEYCDAGSLRQAVLKRKFYDDTRKQPRVDLILEAAKQLAAGLAHIHTKGIIHGDLNPNNVGCCCSRSGGNGCSVAAPAAVAG
jgi:hypothetical protein